MPSLNTVREFSDGKTFVLAEKIGDYREAALAQAEYWGEGYCCRKIPVVPKHDDPFYEVWVGPKRKVQLRTLPGEVIKRTKGSRVLRVVA